MRDSSLLVLSLVLVSGLVSSAPVEKAPELSKHPEVLEVAKRDQEMILFGNQQNDPRVIKKKSDPEMPVIADDTEDKQGFIEALPPVPVKEEQTDDSQEQTAVEADDIQQQSGESVEAELPPIKQDVPVVNSEESQEEESEPVEDANSNSVEEELKGIMADSSSQDEAQEVEAPSAGEEVPEVPSEEPTDESVSDNEVPEDSVPEESSEAVESVEDKEPEETEMVPVEPAVDNSLMDFYYYMLENEKAREEPQQGDYYYDLNYFPYRRRRSSRRARAVTEGDMTHNELQRSKRIKRDLFDDEDEGYYYPYADEEYTPELSDEDLYELYRVEPKYEDEVETLLDMYQQAPEDQGYEPYEPYTVEDVYPELYEEAMEEEEEEPEEPQYVPTKRQMMSTLPGIKKRYFYPFSREPQTHWGAFVPEQKRDYDQTYRRLLALASALSEESPYYQAYRKK